MADQAATALMGGVALLERAMGYALGGLELITPESLRRATPCAEWDVRKLLVHVVDSLDVLCNAVDMGAVLDATPGAEAETAAELVSAVRDRACRLLGAWVSAAEPDIVSIYGRSLSRTIVAGTGAIEIAVHGWDLAKGCGHDRDIPKSLAEDLGQLAPLVVSHRDRPHRFGYPVPVSPDSSPGDWLVAFLGRDPRWTAAPRSK
ncbi:MAG TPA: TIGR03086 family metal-binding protein [Jiangellales bacterium]|nr:TIGR03086 family metal-binding protein [Jiangellales bacterium]